MYIAYKDRDVILQAYTTNVLHDNHVIHDSGANCGIFKNLNLLENVHITDTTATIHGIGGDIETNIMGTFLNRHHVYYHPDAVANILSQSAEKDNGAIIEYDNDADQYILSFTDDHTYVPLIFNRVGGLYCVDMSNMDDSYYAMGSSTVRMNKLKYTKREVQRADEVMKLRRRLSFPADETIPKYQSIINIPITRKDVVRSIDIYGKDRNSIRGKDTKRKTDTVHLESVYKPSDVPQVMNIDIFFIDGEGYLISVLTPLDYVIITRIMNRTSEALRAAVYYHLQTAESEHYEVTHILCDGEKGFVTFFNHLLAAGYLINPSGPGQHVPVVERKIRLVKERIRAYLQSIPYQLMFSLLRYLVEYVTLMLNLEPNSTREDSTSPHELFRGLKVDYKKQLRISFGDYAECHDPHNVTSNDVQSRTDPCIALLPLLNAQGSHLFLNLETRRTCTRDKWTELPFPADILRRLNKLAANQRKKLRVLPNFSYDPVDENDNFIDHMDDSDLFDNAPDPVDDSSSVSVHDDESVHDNENIGEHGITAEEIQDVAENERIREEIRIDNEAQHDSDINVLNPIDKYLPDDLYQETDTPMDTMPQHRYSTRSKGAAQSPYPIKDGRRWINAWLTVTSKFHATALTIKQKKQFGVYSNMTVRQAIDEYGTAARKAVMDELKQLIRLKVLKFHKPDQLDPTTLKSRLPSKTFVRVKFDANNVFEKIKARLVGGGHRQKRYLYSESETSSPTISLVGLYIVATIAADEERTVITADVAGAYLRAYMKKFVLIQINKEESAILVEMYPELIEYLDDDGKLTAECLKALYGLIESGRLWFDTIKEKLLQQGYVQNPYEPCIFNKWHDDAQVQSTIGVYVDDLLTTCKNSDIAESIITWLEAEFDELKVTRGKIHKFTGMTFDFSEKQKLKITMKKSIEEVLKRNTVTGFAATPSTEDLFQIDEMSPRLSKPEAEKFHSEVASINYIAKRIKPECLTITSFLMTRVQSSTEQDMQKFQRLINYVNSTKDIPLCLEMSPGPLEIVANIDSSHASHGDYRGHTGVFITLGKGAIQAISTKQSINTKSSAESELVAASDGATPAINVLNIVKCQGIAVHQLIIEQDNQSTLAMIANGRATGPTSRHINIRYFWLNDRLAQGEISMRYMPTEEMTADLLTKHKDGKSFYKHRQALLNLPLCNM